MATQEGRSQEFFGRIAGKEAYLPSHFTSFYLLAQMSLDISIPCKNYFKEPYSKIQQEFSFEEDGIAKACNENRYYLKTCISIFIMGFPRVRTLLSFLRYIVTLVLV